MVNNFYMKNINSTKFSTKRILLAILKLDFLKDINQFRPNTKIVKYAVKQKNANEKRNTTFLEKINIFS